MNNNLDELVQQMGSSDNQTALKAIARLREEKWLFDGSLRGMNFDGANLEGADLRSADLRECSFISVNFHRANLLWARLEGANLTGADLSGAGVYYKVPMAGVGGVRIDETTTAPDGEPCPAHDTGGQAQHAQEFYYRFCRKSRSQWRSDDPASPAFRGKKPS